MIDIFDWQCGTPRDDRLNPCSMSINLMKFLTVLISLLAVAGRTTHVAEAATSDWATSEGGQMRVVAVPPDADGNIRAALQIEPKAGWITYWREPGEGGIPPQFTLAPDGNLSLEAIAYPVPKPLMIGSVEEIGYDSAVALPLDFKVTDKDKPIKIDLAVFI